MERNVRIALLASDLDGTILPPGGCVSEADIDALGKFSGMGVTTVLVTGRSMFSYRRTLPQGLPFDYVIFSTGAGIWDNRNRELLRCRNLKAEETARIASILLGMGMDFMLQHAVPDNHHFSYHTHGRPVPDFLRRLAIYEGFHEAIEGSSTLFEASQAIVILPGFDKGMFKALEERLSGFKVVRTTSPIDQASVWVEVFPEGVSKGHGLASLCDTLGIPLSLACAVGNDYNDIDMLEAVGHPYVVGDAPPELRERYAVLPAGQPIMALLEGLG